jgi:hypothetical protein
MESAFSKLISNVKLIMNGIGKMKKAWDKDSPRLFQLLSPETWENFAERVELSSETWANYGWVPFLPDSNLDEIIGCPDVPESQETTDEFMQVRIDSFGVDKLFSALKKSSEKQELNLITLNESILCFENDLYSACALCVFALIDEQYLHGQPSTPEKRRRWLAKPSTAENFNKSFPGQSFFSAMTTNKIIERFFSDAKDFRSEDGLNRNFLCHGMNKYYPNKTDCLKLFVLLFNVYSLFGSKLYNWNGKVVEG